MQEVFKAAEAIIRDTGIWIKSSRKARGSGTIEVKGANDFVTQTDLEAEQKLVAGLSPLIRNAGFLTEEGSIAESDSPTYRWIIDPIDGTTNFIHDLPCYSVSVGLEKFTNGIPDLIWGMVYEISREESFIAVKNNGAFLNGNKILIRPSSGLEGSLIATGFPYTQFEWMPKYLEVLSEVLEKCRGVRRWGSAAVDLSYVAAGRFNGYFEYNLNPWDVSAGVLLVREAGGIVQTFEGTGDPVHKRSLICGSPELVKELADIISRRFI